MIHMRPLTPAELRGVLDDLEHHARLNIHLTVNVELGERVPPGTLRISVGPDAQEECTPMILPSHKTFSNKKTPITLSPAYTDASGAVVPDPDAIVTVTSSDPSVGVEQDANGQWWITTPGDSGAATITISAQSPNADYESAALDFSYGPPIAGQLNVSIGSDVSDS